MTAALPQDTAELTGAILSRKYKLGRRLGSGGMGTVYEAAVDGDPQRYAVKILHPEFLGDVDVVRRFVDEGKTCERLVHPNIVRVVETATAEDGSPYFAMEALDGVPLGAYTQNGGRVPLQQAVTIMQGILAGLAAAHAQGVIHRDLKPGNVLLARTPTGQFQVKLVDFGIAKVMDVAGGMGQKTRTGTLLGTPAYMSPEQIRSTRDVDARADLWSAGVMFYEMLTGRVAFPAPTEYARLAAVLNTTPQPAEQIDPELTRVGPVIGRAMQKDREARFASALEMARALTATMGNSDASALSRLPDVPSLFAPQVNAVGSAPTPAPPAPLAASVSVPEGYVTQGSPNVGPGGTLTSSQGQFKSDRPPPNVVITPKSGGGGTLPSENLPMFDPVTRGATRLKSGVPIWLVVMIVVIVLGAGFGGGFFFARR